MEMKMFKNFIMLVLLLFCTVSSVYAMTLEGNVTYTVESARQMTFDGIQKTIPVSSFRSQLMDPDYKANKDLMKYGLQASDRGVAVFKTGRFNLAYAVTYYRDPKKVYYYTKNGNALLYMDILEKSKKDKNFKYPVRIYRYNTKGNLTAAGIHISDDEAFLYDNNGKLITHVVYDTGYSKSGKKKWTSEVVEF